MTSLLIDLCAEYFVVELIISSVCEVSKGSRKHEVASSGCVVYLLKKENSYYNDLKTCE